MRLQPNGVWKLVVLAFICPDQTACFTNLHSSALLKATAMNRLEAETADDVIDESFASMWTNSPRHEHKLADRRRFLRDFIGCSSVLSALTSADKASAACLSGDTNPDCIGVYKLPLDDEVLPYIDTPENLSNYVPGISRWVPPVQYPPNYAKAISELQKRTVQFDQIESAILSADFTAAGTTLLDITPHVILAGRVIVKKLDSIPEFAKMRSYRVEVALTELATALGQLDVEIGQAIRGELGATAPAQLQLLQMFRDGKQAFANLNEIIPKDSSV